MYDMYMYMYILRNYGYYRIQADFQKGPYALLRVMSCHITGCGKPSLLADGKKGICM